MSNINPLLGAIRVADFYAGSAIRTASRPARGNGLMAVGLLLTTATQFRLPGSPFGPGELCVLLWIVLNLCLELARSGPPLTLALRRLLMFWLVFAFAQSLGTLTGFAIGDEHDPSLFWHDVLAYPLVAVFSCLSVVEPGAGHRLHRTAELFAMLGAVCLGLQLMVAADLIGLPLINPWFGNRFQGWSNNPNQLAFLCAIVVLVSLHLADAADRPGKRVAALFYMVPAIVVGRLTKTDTFTFSLLGAVPIYVMLKAKVWLGASGQKLSFRTAFAWIAVVTVPLMLISAAPIAFSAATGSSQLAMSLMKGNGKEASAEADLRLVLWGEAIDRGFQAYMLGLGPGPHLPIPPQIVAARRTEPDLNPSDHPAVNATPNFEAHNSPLDLFTQGGLIAVGSFFWLVGMAFLVPYRLSLAGPAALLVGVAIFGLTNNIVRPPIFWFAIALCLVAGDRRGGTRQYDGVDVP